MIAPCARCPETYSRAERGRASWYCPKCRAIRNRVATKVRKRQQRSGETPTPLDKAQADVAYPRRRTPQRRPGTIYAPADMGTYDDAERASPGEPLPLVPDEHPDGWLSDAGPPEGTSTYFKHLAGVLHGRAAAAVGDVEAAAATLAKAGQVPLLARPGRCARRTLKGLPCRVETWFDYPCWRHGVKLPRTRRDALRRANIERRAEWWEAAAQRVLAEEAREWWAAHPNWPNEANGPARQTELAAAA